ncbi:MULTISPECIES: glycosyltransferase [unclassified Nocardioides]|uniref:glycosyltransferase n=1 Tax=Nocardioides sp. URHA0032 TaxID=1380388 RepID=UPI00068866BB|nr:glycosyltransferase [Nocardioides sp. URHA0032]
MNALVVALVGTDHHPFDRLVGWIDDAAARHGDVRFVVQHGVTRAPSRAEGHDFLARGVLDGLLEEATAVVCHGGPALVMDAREAGHVPLCVPRDPVLGEHVDDHQQRFAELVGRVGVVVDIRSQAAFESELARALREGPPDPGSNASVHEARDLARTRAAAELAAVMLRSPTGRPRRRRHAPA